MRQWTCNGRVPTRHLGYFNFGIPLLVVEVSGSRLTVRLIPKFHARLLGVAPLIAEPGSGLTVTTKRGELGWGQSIYFQLPRQAPYRVWTGRQEAQAMLSCLADAGFKVPVAKSK